MGHTHHILQGPGNILEEEEVCKSGKGMGETSGVSKPEPRLFRSALRPDQGNNFWTPWSALSATLLSSDSGLCPDNSVGRIPVTPCLWKHALCPPKAPRLWVIKVTPDSGFCLRTEDFRSLCPSDPQPVCLQTTSVCCIPPDGTARPGCCGLHGSVPSQALQLISSFILFCSPLFLRQAFLDTKPALDLLWSWGWLWTWGPASIFRVLRLLPC